MALTGSFTANGQYSPEFYGGRMGFDIAIVITAGTNSLQPQKQVAGSWVNYFTAKTATGNWRAQPGVDYTPGTKWRLQGPPTFDTGPVTYGIDGDIIGSEASMSSVGGSMLRENEDDMLREDGEYMLREAA